MTFSFSNSFPAHIFNANRNFSTWMSLISLSFGFPGQSHRFSVCLRSLCEFIRNQMLRSIVPFCSGTYLVAQTCDPGASKMKFFNFSPNHQKRSEALPKRKNYINNFTFMNFQVHFGGGVDWHGAEPSSSVSPIASSGLIFRKVSEFHFESLLLYCF